MRLVGGPDTGLLVPTTRPTLAVPKFVPMLKLDGVVWDEQW